MERRPAARVLVIVACLVGASVGKGLGQAPAPAGTAGATDGYAGDLTAPRPLPFLDGLPLPVPPPPGPSPDEPRAGSERQSYTLQVGAFRALDAAERLAARLTSRGYAAFVLSVDLGPSGQGVWHRVRVGRFSSREAAEAVAAGLATAEGLVAQVLRETGSSEGLRQVDMPPMGR